MTPESTVEAQKKAQRITNAYHRVFRSEDGQMILEHLGTYFCTDRPAFQRSMNHPYDPLAAALRDGQREVLLFIQHKLSEPLKGDGDNDEPRTQVIR